MHLIQIFDESHWKLSIRFLDYSTYSYISLFFFILEIFRLVAQTRVGQNKANIFLLLLLLFFVIYVLFCNCNSEICFCFFTFFFLLLSLKQFSHMWVSGKLNEKIFLCIISTCFNEQSNIFSNDQQFSMFFIVQRFLSISVDKSSQS